MRLTWFIRDTAVPGSFQGPAYRLDRNYRPVALWVHVTDTQRVSVQVDINDDGASIMGDPRPALTAPQTNYFTHRFGPTVGVLREGSVITLDIDSGNAQNLTVQLDLE